MRAQALTQMSPGPGNIATSSLRDQEVQHCAATIAAAFLNPIHVKWDFDRFAESERKHHSGKYFPEIHLDKLTQPTTIVDIHGRILAWYLPGLLLPYLVEELNSATIILKKALCNSVTSRGDPSTYQAEFGAGVLSVSIGKFLLGHKRLQDPIYHSPTLRHELVQQWLQMIQPVEELLDAVILLVHPEMWKANRDTVQKLLSQLDIDLPVWPTVYPALDVIANRVTPRHCNQGGASSFYDHLFPDLQAELAYPPGTSALFTGKVLAHEVPKWSQGERNGLLDQISGNVIFDVFGSR
ncbi:hypothetical protein HD554DRAFT_2331554 [Boletus coccyginus]|nr:hypothetical protein HD554DRAFT_2331554 [Boletus coccyginus]